MNSYSFSDDAIQDLDEICEYIARKNPDAAIKVFETIRQRCKAVAEFPNSGKRYDYLALNLRGFIVDDYIIFYYPREDGINVARVVSGRRDLEKFFSNYEGSG